MTGGRRIARSTPEPALHAYNALISIALPADDRAWLLAELYAAAQRPPPPPSVLAAMVARGPVRTLRALRLPGFGRRRRAHLRTAFSHPGLATTLAERLQQLTQQPLVVPDNPPLPHPFGAEADFPPRVARVLGQEGGLVYGDARPIPGFPFNDHIIGFREAVRRPPPPVGLIIGAGYIGVEMAVAWGMAGSDVILLERRPEILAGYSPEQIQVVRALLDAAGVRFRLGAAASGWRRSGGRIVVAGTWAQGRFLLTADLLVLAVGLDYSKPNAMRW